jgi:hypothetical protein
MFLLNKTIYNKHDKNQEYTAKNTTKKRQKIALLSIFEPKKCTVEN